ncbi:MAG: chromosome segregation protein SMC [Blautia sp.]|nr:chromosome segregation protein SMC [Blautia sp.]
MYLKNIEVHGFKSFAQKINFEFHNGITGIVGPNGSGKSNVADAVRWVLGEQSAKQLRGGNMQDVIFSGTELRKPLSFASVAITLDNTDRAIPVDYNEITVTRRLYRSGESEYLINGTACRLRDINEMFYDTGIGKEGYSIIGQGQIDKILSGKPEERRELFDEAAGIVKFKRRKNATLKKLDEEQANLVRVTDILNEVTRRLGPLERQSETARIYLARREEQRVLDVNLFLVEHELTKKELDDLNEKNSIAEKQLAETQAAYDETRQEYDRLEKVLDELTGSIDELRDDIQTKAVRRQELSGRVDVLREQIAAGDRNSEIYKARLTAIEEDLKRRNTEKEALEERLSEARAGLKKGSALLAEKEIRLQEIRENAAECERAVEEGKNEIIELLNSRAATKGQAQRNDALVEQVNIRKAGISKEILSLKSEEEQLLSQKAEAERSLEAVNRLIEDMTAESEHLQDEIQKIHDELKKQNDKMEIGQRTFHREESRLESLRNMAERYDGYGNSIRRVMEQKDKEKGILGVVADLIQVEKDYEIAIETALGGSIQNIVTDDEQTAKRMIEFLKRNRFGRATFLPLNSINTRQEFSEKRALSEKGAIGVASTLVKCEDRFKGLAKYLLGRILVVDNIDNAIAIARKYRHSFRMVTLEGESLNPGGAMTGGAFKNNSNLLGRRREIEDLETSIELLKKDIAVLQKEINDNRSRRNVLRDTAADLQEKLRTQFVERNTKEMNLSSLNEKLQEVKAGYARYRREQEEVKERLSELKADNDQVDKLLEASKKDEEELETYIDTRMSELEEWKAEEARISEEIGEARLEVSQQEQKESFARENLARVDSEINSLTEEETQMNGSLDKSRSDAEDHKKEIDLLIQTVSDFEKEESESKKKLAEKQKEKEEQTVSHRQFFERRDELSQQISLLDKETFRLRSQSEKLEENQEARINYLWEEYEITPSSASELKREGMTDRRQMRKQIAEIRDEIKKLGAVNVSAIEEYKELQERHTFLSGQYEDLKKAEETLRNAILELDEGMRRQFSAKFKDIQREFDKAFKELFGGGKGTLELMEDKDILEAGIQIISQPPGKKLQNMMQLSGGEKALTAIALLFAIQNLKPSPFCLLDEIEAALDDSNVGRFAGYLQKLTKNTQFIIITHRRGTMNAADRLYGITMQEKGISTLVSVDLVENQLT